MDAEHYRRRARRYLIRARQMLNPINRVTMVDMAVIWMRMAEWAEPENPVIQQQQQRNQPQVPSLAATSRSLEPDSNTNKTILPGAWGGLFRFTDFWRMNRFSLKTSP